MSVDFYYRKILLFIMRWTQFWGLFTSDYDDKQKCFISSKRLKVYSIIVTIGIFIFLPLNVIIYFLFYNECHTFESNVWIFQTILNISIAIIIYFQQLFNNKNIQEFLNRFLKINEFFKMSNENNQSIHNRWPIQIFLIKQFIVEFFYMFLTIVYSFSQQKKIGLGLGLSSILISYITFSIISNCYFICQLRVLYYFEIINYHLIKIDENVKNCNNEKKSSIKQLKQCEVSEKLDEIAVLYQKLATLIKMWNDLCSIKIPLTLTSCYFNCAFQVYFQYHWITEGLIDGYIVYLDETLWLFLSFLECFLYIYASCMVANVAEITNILLHNITIKNIDISLHKSIQSFSLKINQHNFFINISKMFIINHQMFYTILTSVFSNLIILIQFDLALK